MKLSEFYYPLDKGLIAQSPLKDRSSARLLLLKRESEEIEHHYFYEIVNFLKPGDVLVLNNTKVFKAGLKGKRSSGGRIEILLWEKEGGLWKALVFPAKKIKPGMKLYLDDLVYGEVKEKVGTYFFVFFNLSDEELMMKFGTTPIPHYIKREPNKDDEEYYQTVYAKKMGSIAAPTAGLHFTPQILDELRNKGIVVTEITLHIGPGTFKPIRVEEIERHKMEPEYFEISQAAGEKILNAKRVIAVGTSVTRTLESLTLQKGDEKIGPLTGRTELFIYPGHKFKIINGLLTNFHLPCSTPLLLVCAFAGKELTFKSYREAIKRNYRFLSYGDAMLIL